MIGIYTRKFETSEQFHLYANDKKGDTKDRHWYINSRLATNDDIANATEQCFQYLVDIRDNYSSLVDFTGLKVVSSTVNTLDASNPYVSITLERPIIMSSNYYGNPEFSMDFEYGKKY